MSYSVLAILRAKIFSNRAIDADRAIMEEVLSELSFACPESLSIKLIAEENFNKSSISTLPDTVLTMGQKESTLSILNNLENQGVKVINNSNSIRNCFRENLINKVNKIANCPYVSSTVMHTADLNNDDIGLWIKRADFHATEDTDVFFMQSKSQLFEMKNNFLNRNITKVIKQPHLPGKILKFYGVGNTIVDIRDMGISGYNRYELKNNNIKFSIDKTKIENNLSPILQSLQLDIYGGDLVLDDSGNFTFIDINDWPSFRTCRTIAAKAIAEMILSDTKL